MRLFIRGAVALILASFVLAVPTVAHARRLPPIQVVKRQHPSWDAAQWRDFWAVLWRESTSSPGHVNIHAENGSSGCVGSGQFLSWSQYYVYGGNPYTVVGQLKADANYDAERYGSPAGAWAHELEDGWY